MQDAEIRQIPLSALIIGLAVILPQFFHLIGLGATFLPMYLPIMVGSMFLTWKFVILTAVISPLISWLITGMPPIVPPVLPVLMIELTVIGLFISFLRQYSARPVWLITILAVLLDRLVLLLIVEGITPLLGITSGIFTAAVVVAGIPGSVLQIFVVPFTVKLIEKKYPQWKISRENR